MCVLLLDDHVLLGLYNLDIKKGWWQNFASKWNAGSKTSNVTRENRGKEGSMLSELLLDIPSKCVANKAFPAEERQVLSVNANCRMFQWCLRKMIAAICPTQADEDAAQKKNQTCVLCTSQVA